MRRFTRPLLFGLSLGLSVTSTAKADTMAGLVAAAGDEAPNFALGAAIAAGGTPPEVFVTGPTRKGGDTPVDADAPWHVGSITKSFTAALIMRLTAQGQLDLDTPIGGYLDVGDLHPDWAAITLRQLLSHTAGLSPNASMAHFRKRSPDNLHALRGEVLSANWTEPLPGKAGEYTYSNFGYVLAGYIAETVSGQTWEELIRSEIAVPLGLTSLGFGAPKAEGAAWGHRNYVFIKRAVRPDNTAADNPPWLGPAGTIHLSLSDLIRWGQAHLAACAGDLLHFLSAADCQTLQTEVQEGYGLGWVIGGTDAAPLIWHNGSNTMWYTVLALQPDRGRAIAVSTNVYDAKRIDALVGALSSVP